MIIVLFGQPSSGKTTLAHAIHPFFADAEIVDGDAVRQITQNQDYTKEGRIRNLKNVSEYACELSTERIVIVSAIYPYEISRRYLNDLHNDVLWIHLSYPNVIRDKSSYHVHDFEPPMKNEKLIQLNTGLLSISSCTYQILYFYNAYK